MRFYSNEEQGTSGVDAQESDHMHPLRCSLSIPGAPSRQGTVAQALEARSPNLGNLPGDKCLEA